MIEENNSDFTRGLTDKELVERVKHGDEKALDLLVKRYYNMVYFTCIKTLSDNETALDATQEIFIKAWKNIKTCTDGSFFLRWLFTITRNHCIDILRKEKKQKEREVPLEEYENQDKIAHISGNDENIYNKYEFLKTCIEQLPESQRIIIQKRLEGRSVQEIADELNCPLGTVLSRLSLAKKRIYEHMRRNQITFEDL